MNARNRRILHAILISAGGLTAVLVVAGIFIARTVWFREYVRTRIIDAVQDSTGGRVELGRFSFDWPHLRADIRGFMVHGNEPAGAAPLFRANEITLHLRPSSLWKRRRIELQSLAVRQPQVNIMLLPNGTTNVPEAKLQHHDDKTGLETIVDLAIGQFQVDDGTIQFAEQKMPLSASGENLTAQLSYETLGDQYRGRVSMDPLFVRSGANSPINLNLDLPVVLGRDRIELANAVISTKASRIQIAGRMDHLVAPNVSARAAGQIDLAEMKRAFGLPFAVNTQKNVPHTLYLDAGVNTETEGGRVSHAHLLLGQSSCEVTGAFRDLAALQGSLQFTSNLALSELARILQRPAQAGQLPFQAGGTVQLTGNAVLNGASNYTVDANLNGRNLEYRKGDIHVSNLNVSSRIAADPHSIRANKLQATWLGGKLDGRATVQGFDRYRFDGRLSGFDLQRAGDQIASRRIGYAGTISGTLEAEGRVKAPASPLETATARIAIAPKSGGVPVRGQINASYNRPARTVVLGQSFIALPSSKLDLSGDTSKQITAHFVSHNLDDLRPAVPEMAARLDTGGSAVVDAAITGEITAPRITAHAAVTRFAVEQRHFDLLAADLTAESNRAALQNGTLTHGALNARFEGAVGLQEWKTTPSVPLDARVSIQNADLMDLLALADKGNLPLRGALTLSASASGTLGNPSGAVNVDVANGEAYGQPIDRLISTVNFAGQTVNIPSMQITSGVSRVNLNATFQHPLNDFSNGTLRAHVEANQVTLARVEPLHQRRPDLDGDIQLNLDAEAVVGPEPKADDNNRSSAPREIRLISANGSVGARRLRLKGESLGNLAAMIQTQGSTVSYRVDSDFAGSTIRADGRTDLNADYHTEANLNIRNLPIEKALAITGEQTIVARGALSANGKVGGTLREPHANLDVSLSRAKIRDEAIDQLQGHVDYSSTLVNVPSLTVQAGPNRIMASVSFTHPAQDFSTGDVKTHIESDSLQIGQLAYLQQLRPGLAGSLKVNVDGAATLNHSSSEPRIMLASLNGEIRGSGIRANGKDLGGFTATAQQNGSTVKVALDSNLAQSQIRLDGEAQLTRNYPVSGRLTFENVRYSNLASLLGRTNPNQSPDFDALIEGSANVSGPAYVPADLSGSAQISKLELTTKQGSALKGTRNLALHNDGPITLVANQNGIQVQQAHITGPSTDVAVIGNVTLRPAAAFNLTVNGDTDLALIQQIDKSSSASGKVSLRAAVTGSPTQPVINGRLELKNAAYQQIDWPNGISNANGAIVFTGTAARIESLTAESGGGRITATGNVTRTTSGVIFNLQSRANRVLVRTDAGVSLTANANLRLSGTDRSSVLSGDITIVRAAFNPQNDIASILAPTAAPAETPGAPEGLLANMQMDVAVRMAPGAMLQSAYTQSLQAQADLGLRGNVLSPGMIGRVNITQGNVVFFGNKYNINEGSVTFYNPYKIQPVLDLNLETNVQSVDVVLTVTGPVENMNLAYHSDPPLPFSEIVALLGAGKTPTSDPVLVANQPQAPPQSMADVGASALLGATVANPVSGQLQRIFGVSQLKISPTFVTGSTLPQAQVTLQQQVASNVVFTYVSDLSSPDSQILRVEWAINPQWSAVASRESNGVVGVDLFYKRRFR